MGEITEIAWTDYTFNPWEGCSKIGPGCSFCYAEVRNTRWHAGVNWGPGAPRRRTGVHNWNDPRRWNRKVSESGKRWVFCASLADVFDNEVDPAWRVDLWNLIRECKELRWQLVTKRIGLANRYLPEDWEENFGHVGIIATIVNEAEARRDMPKLAATRAAWRGVSYEPALGPVDWTPYGSFLDWLIVGGESGAGARPFDPEWAADAVRFGAENGVPVFVKQMGANPLGLDLDHSKGGRPDEWAPELMVREMPRVY